MNKIFIPGFIVLFLTGAFAADYNSQFVNQSVPLTMYTGEQLEVTVTFKNVGSETWSGPAGYSLGSQGNNETWGRKRVYLYSDTVAPGAKKKFVFTITAPLAEGEYNFRWRMVKQNVAWFGDYSKNVKILVKEPLSVSLVTPNAEENVSGTIPVTVNITSSAVKTEFYVDGYPYDCVTTTLTGQYTFNWDTLNNHLPPLEPGRTIDYAYYGIVGAAKESGDLNLCYTPEANPSFYGDYTKYCHIDFSHKANGFTNAFIATPAAYNQRMLGEEGEDIWQAWFAQDMANAAANNRAMQLDLLMNGSDNGSTGEELNLKTILDIAQPHWNLIKRIEVAHEPTSNKCYTTREQMVQDFELVAGEIQNRGLVAKPLGVSLKVNSPCFKPATRWFSIPYLDWVGVEAYIDPKGKDSELNIAKLYDSVAMDMNRIPADKDIVLIMMAYTWNGLWKDIDDLRDLQIPTYLIARNDNRVVGINMFAFRRKDLDNPQFYLQLRTPHKLIWEKISGTTLAPPDGPAGNGRRTLLIKVYDAEGNSAKTTAIVNVNN